MEGNLRPEAPRPPPTTANIDRHPELARWEIENGRDIRRRYSDVTPDGCTTWTEEKHNSYLRQLEVSFVEQLHQSRTTSDLEKCSDQRQFKVLRNGCWKKNNYYIREAHRELRSTVKLGKRTISPGFATRSHECSTSDPYLGDLFDIEREGTGQNFLDGVYQCTTKFVSQAKRSKKEFVDESSQAISSIVSGFLL